MFGRTLSSQRGMYHDFSPMPREQGRDERHLHDQRVREDRDRQQEAELLRDAVRVRMNAAKTVPMIIAAATMTRPIAAIPCSTASRVFSPWTCSSRIRLMRNTM